MVATVTIRPTEPSYRQIGNPGICAWCGEPSRSTYAIVDPPARALFNIGNCGRAACAAEVVKVRGRVAPHQRVVDLT
jgi:hypothetical protein